MIWFHKNITFNWPRLALGLKSEVPQNQREDYIQNPKLILNPKRPAARIYTAQKTPGNFYIYVKVDPWKIIDIGVWGCQIRIDNTAIIHSVRLMGYPINYDASLNKDPERPNVYDTGYVFAPRPLFAKYFLPAVNHPLNTNLKIEDTYYLVMGIQPIIDFYTDWKENKKSSYDEGVKASLEGPIRSNYATTTGTKFSDDDKDGGKNNKKPSEMWQIWANILYYEGDPSNNLPPDWSVKSTLRWAIVDLRDIFFDAARCAFSNIFSRSLPKWGNVNEKIAAHKLKYWTPINTLALNALVHHDIITLPLGINQTVTTDTMDVVGDITNRFPVMGGFINWAIKGFHDFAFGSSPSGFKRGGQDTELKFYGDSMMGFMSVEMYRFYTGSYFKSLDTEARGIMTFNAFQEQGGDLSTLLNATSNSTGLNFKITDIVEASVYNTKDTSPKIKFQEVISTVHIAQKPGSLKGDPRNIEGREIIKDENTELHDWDEDDVILVDQYFNLHLSDYDGRVIRHFGEHVEQKRLYVVNEVCVQAIGAGMMTLTFFGQNPTVYNAQQVTIWEGKFRNFASVSKSTRAWTTTIRFGQPNIQTIIQYKDEEGKVYKEELKDALYRYPMTILTDIQKRPLLPPTPIEAPGDIKPQTLFTYSYTEWEAGYWIPRSWDIILGWQSFSDGDYEDKDIKNIAPIVHYTQELELWYPFLDLDNDFYLINTTEGIVYTSKRNEDGIAGMTSKLQSSKPFPIATKNTKILRIKDNQDKDGASVWQWLDAWQENIGTQPGWCPEKPNLNFNLPSLETNLFCPFLEIYALFKKSKLT